MSQLKGAQGQLDEAFAMLGGVDAMVEWARQDPSKFYPIWAKLVGTQVEVTTNTTLADELTAALARVKDLKD